MNVQIPVVFSFTLTTNDKLVQSQKPQSNKTAPTSTNTATRKA